MMEQHTQNTERERRLIDYYFWTEQGREKLRHFIERQKTQKKERHYGDTLPGRPYFTADIPIDPWEFEELRLKYYDIIHKLSYKEAMALCRAFDYSYSTFLMRKYHHRQPRFEEIILVTNWFDNGKPVTLNKHHRRFALFF